MKICFISLDYPSPSGGGGVGNQIYTLSQALMEQGHRITVIALTRPGDPAYSQEDGVEVHRFHRGSLHWYASKTPLLGSIVALTLRELEDGWAAYRLARRLHARDPFDVIEGTETGMLGVALLLEEVPRVIRLHGEHYTFHKYTHDLPLTPGIRLSRALQRVVMHRAKALVSPSHAHAQEIAAELGPRHPPIEVIPNAVSWSDDGPRSQELAPQTDVNHLLASDHPLVLFVGRLERLKGVPLLLKAARLVLDEVPGAQFVLAGESHPTLPRAEIQDLMQQFSLDGAVRLLGHVPHKQLALWYRRATLCVLPSYYETFGIAALEPMAFGVPVVATTAGGLPEVVEDGVTGRLVPPGDAKAFAGAITQLLKDRSEQERMGHAGRERAQRLFNVDRAAALTLNVYNRISQNTSQ